MCIRDSFFLIGFISVSFCQFTFNSSPAIGTYVSCPSGDETCISGTYLGGIFKMKLQEIEYDREQFRFRIDRCNEDETIGLDGTLYVKLDNECGERVEEAPLNVPSVAAVATINVPFSVFTSEGSKDFYAVFIDDNGNKYRTGNITIQASSDPRPPNYLNVSTVSSTQIDLEWEPVAGTIAYWIDRSENGGDFNFLESIGGTTNSIRDNQLSPDTELSLIHI